MWKIICKTTHKAKTGKVTYKQIGEIETHEMTEALYKSCVDAKQFFKNLGGKEFHQKSYTSYGYVVTSIKSTSPDLQNQTLREFSFIRTERGL